VVKVGVQLFKELGDRQNKLEQSLGTYREAMVSLAESQGVEVPDFLTAEAGSLGEPGSAEQLRGWLQGVLGKPGAKVGSRSRGRSAKSAVSGRSARGKGARETKSKKAERMDERD
jgi:hypothetical protein